jgi:hypothetical protein
MEEIKLLLPKALRDKLEVKASQQDQSLNQYLVTQLDKLLAAPSVISEPTFVSDEEVAKLKAKLIKSDDNEIILSTVTICAFAPRKIPEPRLVTFR